MRKGMDDTERIVLISGFICLLPVALLAYVTVPITPLFKVLVRLNGKTNMVLYGRNILMLRGLPISPLCG